MCRLSARCDGHGGRCLFESRVVCSVLIGRPDVLLESKSFRWNGSVWRAFPKICVRVVRHSVLEMLRGFYIPRPKNVRSGEKAQQQPGRSFD